MKKNYGPKSFKEIIVAFGGPAAVARELDLPDSARVRQWKANNAIPPVWWGPIADAAKRRRLVGVTRTRLEELANK